MTYYIIKTRNGQGIMGYYWIEEYYSAIPEMEILGTFYTDISSDGFGNSLAGYDFKKTIKGMALK